jgi:hypothetical protein
LEFSGVYTRGNETPKKAKEAWTKTQDRADSSNGSQKREKHENQPPSKSLGFHPSQDYRET